MISIMKSKTYLIFFFLKNTKNICANSEFNESPSILLQYIFLTCACVCVRVNCVCMCVGVWVCVRVFFNSFLHTTFAAWNVVLLYSFHGNRGHFAGEHVNRHDGQHLSKDRRDQKRMAETSELDVYNIYLNIYIDYYNYLYSINMYNSRNMNISKLFWNNSRLDIIYGFGRYALWMTNWKILFFLKREILIFFLYNK